VNAFAIQIEDFLIVVVKHVLITVKAEATVNVMELVHAIVDFGAQTAAVLLPTVVAGV
jgi:hypothetical protein